VEKVLERYELLVREFGEENVLKMTGGEEEKEILKTQLEHGKAIREERRKAEKEKRKPDFITLCRQWGGVTLAYRKRMVDSPAYRLNHEEVIKALEEGIYFAENLNPIEAVRGPHGSVAAMIFERGNKEKVELPAKSVCVAAGTSPNTIYEREYPGSFKLDEKKNFFQKFVCVEKDGKWELEPASPGDPGGFFLSHQYNGRFVTFYGDNHPDYAGNVVKAMASAKHGAAHIRKLFKAEIALADKSPVDPAPFHSLTQFLDEALVPKVVKVNRLTPTIVEVIVKARFAARKFEPGQFYRLQNYESLTHAIDRSRLLMEGIALTGAWVDKEKDLLSLIVLEMGTSSRLCSILKPGDPVVVMGPTGTPTEIPEGQSVLLAGGGLGNAVLLSVAKACRERNSKVIYFAGYRRKIDLFKQDEIEQVTDQVIWAVDAGDPIVARRPQDLSFVGNIVQAMESYATGKLQPKPLFDLKKVDHLIAIGSDRMMAAVGAARHGVLKPHLKPDHKAIASINSPMQCMMKEVCAQCLQRHVDPKTGKETFVFSCFNQDQEIDCVDFKHLRERLGMNLTQEMLSNQYLDYLFQRGKIERV
jgi:NAD(P)H-flavin reductase